MGFRNRWRRHQQPVAGSGHPRWRQVLRGVLLSVAVLGLLLFGFVAYFGGPEQSVEAQPGPGGGPAEFRAPAVSTPPGASAPSLPSEPVPLPGNAPGQPGMAPPVPPLPQPAPPPAEAGPGDPGPAPPAVTPSPAPVPPSPAPRGSVPGTKRMPPVVEPDAPSFTGPRPPEFLGSRAPEGLGLVDGVVFGRQVYGLHPELLRRLREAERLVREEVGPDADLGVDTIVGYRTGSKAHSSGRAVDINYYANPYIMHERGEAELNRRLAEVYHRIARLTLGRDSVIPEEITRGAPDPERTLRLYRELREESRAMIAYFRLMQDRAGLERHLAAVRAPSQPDYWDHLLPGGEPVTVAALQRQMMRDYVTLAGRAGPPVPGMSYPVPDSGGGNAPFSGDATYRGPEFGFLNLSEALVRALTQAGIRWGGTDMGNGSGDIMHFFLTADELETVSAGNKRR